jgi:Tfp pilus assembly protein PilF
MAQNNRGTALRALGKTAEALEAFRAAIALDDTLARAHANLGQMLADQGQLAEGLVYCRDAVRRTRHSHAERGNEEDETCDILVPTLHVGTHVCGTQQ